MTRRFVGLDQDRASAITFYKRMEKVGHILAGEVSDALMSDTQKISNVHIALEEATYNIKEERTDKPVKEVITSAVDGLHLSVAADEAELAACLTALVSHGKQGVKAYVAKGKQAGPRLHIFCSALPGKMVFSKYKRGKKKEDRKSTLLTIDILYSEHPEF